MAAVVYLTLGTLLARVQPRRRLKIYLIALPILVAFAGRGQPHLPWRALAERRARGLGAGASWAVLCWVVVLWLQRRAGGEAGRAQ